MNIENRKQTKNEENEKKNGHLIQTYSRTRIEKNSKISTARLVELEFQFRQNQNCQNIYQICH